MSGAAPAGEVALEAAPYLRPHPGPLAVFTRRAGRFQALAPGHAAGDYLLLLARLAAAQAEAARRLAVGPAGLDAADAWAASIDPEMPPFDPERRWPAGWREALATILTTLRGEAGPVVQAALGRLEALGPEPLARLAERVLCGRPGHDEVALAPFVGAALQVAWTAAAAAVPPAEVARRQAGCPLCGGPPVAGVILGDDKLRYLVCGLCASEWHHTRAQCVLCRDSGQLAYDAVAGDQGPAKAEACGGCQAYLKLLYAERDPRLEPMADDVASVALDLLMAERGLARLGWSYYLIPGEPVPGAAIRGKATAH